MNNEDFILFVTTLLEKINNVDINNDIRIKIKKSDLNSIQLFNFKILATRKLEDANIGIIVSSSGWTIIYGSIYSNILTSNLPSKFKNSDDLISMAENTAITFFDLAMGKVPFVLHLSTVNIKSPNGSIIERLPSIAQFFEKINKKYSQICTTFPNIIDGWDQDQDNPNIKYKLINTIKIMRIESSSINNEDVNKITIDTIKNCSFPIKTNLKSDYIVDSLNKVVPVNELIKFTTKL